MCVWMDIRSYVRGEGGGEEGMKTPKMIPHLNPLVYSSFPPSPKATIQPDRKIKV